MNELNSNASANGILKLINENEKLKRENKESKAKELKVTEILNCLKNKLLNEENEKKALKTSIEELNKRSEELLQKNTDLEQQEVSVCSLQTTRFLFSFISFLENISFLYY